MKGRRVWVSLVLDLLASGASIEAVAKEYDLRAAGHDVATVAEQRLSGAKDTQLLGVCTGEGRALVTLDLDFANPIRFPPSNHAEVAVLRLASPAAFALGFIESRKSKGLSDGGDCRTCRAPLPSQVHVDGIAIGTTRLGCE